MADEEHHHHHHHVPLHSVQDNSDVVYSDIPARIDRLPWSRWHWFLALALGVAWILDGIEVSSISLSLAEIKETFVGVSQEQTVAIGTVYVCGTMFGALLFGVLADKFGRKRLFVVTPITYFIATIIAAAAPNIVVFMIGNFFIGVGIGGEYSAMNSAINELIPSHVRGLVDLAINGSYWLGVAISAAMSFGLAGCCGSHPHQGWRIPFGIGAALAIGVIITRLTLEESPRWLITHNRPQEAEEIVQRIEASVRKSLREGEELEEVTTTIAFHVGGPQLSLLDVIKRTFSKTYIQRSLLGSVLMISQAFFYNAIFFTLSTVLTDFYHEDASSALFLIPFAAGNFLGAVTIGRLFDTIGRKIMICFTYGMSGLLIIITGILIATNLLNAYTATLCWSITFFFSSAGASSAYLTISEIFPMEIRALAIALFYSIGTLGGMSGPLILGKLTFLASGGSASGSDVQVDGYYILYGYLGAAGLMFAAVIVEWIFGVDAEGKSLEDIAAPISQATESESDTLSTTKQRNYNTEIVYYPPEDKHSH